MFYEFLYISRYVSYLYYILHKLRIIASPYTAIKNQQTTVIISCMLVISISTDLSFNPSININQLSCLYFTNNWMMPKRMQVLRRFMYVSEINPPTIVSKKAVPNKFVVVVADPE